MPGDQAGCGEEGPACHGARPAFGLFEIYDTGTEIVRMGRILAAEKPNKSSAQIRNNPSNVKKLSSQEGAPRTPRDAPKGPVIPRPCIF